MKRQELEFISPIELALDVDGKEILISPIRLGKLPELVRAVEPVFGDLLLLMELGTVEAAMRLIGQRGDVIAEVVALCAGLNRREVEEMLPDRVAALLLACCEVNWDFFSRAVPALKGYAQRLAPHITERLASAMSASSSASGQPRSTT